MPVTQLADVIVPEFFAEYMAQNSMTSTALFRSARAPLFRHRYHPLRERLQFLRCVEVSSGKCALFLLIDPNV